MDINADAIRGICSVGFENHPESESGHSCHEDRQGHDCSERGRKWGRSCCLYNRDNEIGSDQGEITRVQAVVVVPVRELALAVCKFIKQVSEVRKLRNADLRRRVFNERIKIIVLN